LLFKLKPVRKEIPEQVTMLADLDKIITRRYGFHFNGKPYILKPVSLEEFASVSVVLVEIAGLNSKKAAGVVISKDEVVDLYFRFINAVCPQFKRTDVEAMTVAQIGAVTQLIVDVVMGRADEKKNTINPEKTAII
jgi:hypothetical protein